VKKLGIIIVDDHPVVRVGLRHLLTTQPDFDILTEAGDADDACRAIERSAADVVLLDWRIPGGGGESVLQFLRAERRATRALVLTTYQEERDVAAAFDRGAFGFLLKDCPKELLFASIRSVALGQIVLSQELADKRRRAEQKCALSSRELQVLRLIAREDSNRAIARQLFISEATVKTHLAHIYEKLGVKQRTAAVVEALRRGLLSIET
jgi:DNA-binding NarL/FixJ family response regulator